MLNAYEHVRNAEDGESSGDDDSEDDGKLNAPDRRERLRAAGLPADAGDDFDEDEEIDEDAAFTAEDEAKYGAMLRVCGLFSDIVVLILCLCAVGHQAWKRPRRRRRRRRRE